MASRGRLVGLQLVASSAQRLDIGAAVTGVELLAQVGDVGLDDVGVTLPVVVVEVFEQLALGDDGLWFVDEVLEDAVLGGGEVDLGSVACDALLERVNGEVAQAEKRSCDTFAAA